MTIYDVSKFQATHCHLHTSMDLLHTQLAALQHQLSFVATEPIDWKFYVQACSWAVTLFESYLLSVTSSAFFFHTNNIIGSVNIRSIRKRHPRRFWLAISTRRRSAIPSCMAETRPSSRSSRACSNKRSTLPCSTMGSTHGRGTWEVGLSDGLGMEPSTR